MELLAFKKPFIIVNPVSANGRVKKLWPKNKEIIRSFIGEFDFEFTTRPNQAGEIARSAIQRGFIDILTIGGDGTAHEVINGFIQADQPISSEAYLGIIPFGTGSDFRKSILFEKEIEKSLAQLKNGKLQQIDVGKINFMSHSGQMVDHYFLNIASFGLSGKVDEAVNSSSKALGGKLSFFIGTLKGLFRYENKSVRLKIDNTFEKEMKINVIAVANGRFFGGGMLIAPKARLDDGLLDVVIIGDISKFDVMKNSSRIYKGTHVELDSVQYYTGHNIEASCQEEVLLDIDGEQLGKLPAKFSVLPKILPVRF